MAFKGNGFNYICVTICYATVTILKILRHYMSFYGNGFKSHITVDMSDARFISNTLQFLTTTRLGATCTTCSWNAAVKRALMGVVPGWVTLMGSPHHVTRNKFMC